MKKGLILHPVFFAAFPVLFIFARNVSGFSPVDVVRPLAVAAGGAGTLWVILAVAFKNARKAAIVVSLAAVMVGSYGHLASVLHFVRFSIGGASHGPEMLLIPLFATLFTTAAYFTVKTTSSLSNLTRILNAASSFLVVFCVVQIGAQLYSSRDALRFRMERTPLEIADGTGADLPNVYYIILDGYGRSDNLRELYDHDNTPFLERLHSMGFYIAENAHANYSHTPLSLSSSLNMEYLDGLADQVGRSETSLEPLRRMIAHSKARRFLNGRGYRFVCFSSGFWGTQIKDADAYLAPDILSEFEVGLLGTTAAATPRGRRKRDQARIMFALEKLPETAAAKAPLFVFAHIIAPHPPFVFTSEGDDTGDERYFFLDSANHLIREDRLTRAQYISRYLAQMEFIEKTVPRCLDAIIENSRVPPVIILQGDHGSGAFLHHESIEGTYLQDRLSILSAYYLPGGGADDLYDSITPVNTFRVVFNRLFGAGMPLQEDRSFYATATHPYDFTEVTQLLGTTEDRARLERLKSTDYYPDDIAIDALGSD